MDKATNVKVQKDRPSLEREDFDEDQKKKFNDFMKDINSLAYSEEKIKAIRFNLEENFKKSKTIYEAKIWVDIMNRFRIIEENMRKILKYDDIVNKE